MKQKTLFSFFNRASTTATSQSAGGRAPTTIDLTPKKDASEEGKKKRPFEETKLANTSALDQIPIRIQDSKPAEEFSASSKKKVKVATPPSEARLASKYPSRKTKRKRLIVHRSSDNSSDDEEEWTPSKNNPIEEDEDDDYVEDEILTKSVKQKVSTPIPRPSFVSPKGKSPRVGYNTPISAKSAAKSFLNTPASATSTKSYASTPISPKSTAATPGATGMGQHNHDTWKWLNEKRRDDQMKSRTDPNFNPRTLYVPPDFLKKETPAMKQWWEFKRKNMDCVLFFKVGKFYELFHMDADIGFKELELIYMKGDKAHSGFPERAYGKFSSILVSRGYRVARIEQTETPEMMKKRNATSKSKGSKVVLREMCSMLSPGTNTRCFLDGQVMTTQGNSQQSESGNLLMSIKENVVPSGVEFGMCIVDCSTGEFRFGQFQDSLQRDRLRTVLSHYEIAEVVYERNELSDDTLRIFKHCLSPSLVFTPLVVGNEFWNGSATLQQLHKGKYFQDESEWPELILECLDDSKEMVKEDCELVFSAFGGCLWNLKRSLIDFELVSMKNIRRIAPPDVNGAQNVTKEKDEDPFDRDFMILDAQTIANLELVENNTNGKVQGTLLHLLDKTKTGFGKRMFRNWLLKPLYRAQEVNARLDAVDNLITNQDTVMIEISSILSRLPDLERMFSRVHAIGVMKSNTGNRSEQHPSTRAIMYDFQLYNQRKIKDFLNCLKGFQDIVELLEYLNENAATLTSPLIQQLLSPYQSGTGIALQQMKEQLAYFQTAFDHEKARRTGVIAPEPGLDEDYDAICADMEHIDEELMMQLKHHQKALRNHQISFWGKKKEERYQLEIPESICGNLRSSEYELKSKKKGFKRYHTPEIKGLLKRLMAAEERKEAAVHDQMRRLFYRFSSHEDLWMSAVTCMSTLDCLNSLATVSANGENYTRPVIKSAKEPFLRIEEGIHPTVSVSFNGGEFIPNSLTLGGSKAGADDQMTDIARMLLISGPNMGGKSTIQRQTCLLVLMGQLGCYVPATKCEFSPVDRIFTRIGASDQILLGQSTFFVELSETSTILNHATPHSLVILDELGRGTSTFDGTAIAYAVTEHLVREIKCRSMFATHYHSLVEEYVYEPKVALGHMDCYVDVANDSVTFLYRLTEGSCPKSYGINVAKLAGLPLAVLECAREKSRQFEQELLKYSSNSAALAQSTYEKLSSLVAQTHVPVAQVRQIWQLLRSRAAALENLES